MKFAVYHTTKYNKITDNMIKIQSPPLQRSNIMFEIPRFGFWLPPSTLNFLIDSILNVYIVE